jgi:signal transduction histidine kinase
MTARADRSADVMADAVLDGAVAGTSRAEADAWERVNPWAGRVIVGVCIMAVVIAAFDERSIARTVPWGVALTVATWLAVLALDRVIETEWVDADPDAADDLTYLRWWIPVLGVLAALWFAATMASPSYFVALFAMYWLFWSTVDLPWGALPTAGLTVLMVVANERWGASWTEAIAQGVISFGMGLAFALYIRVVIEQSSQRRALISELRAAQHHLAAAQHEAGVLAERERLAREIHDTLAQGFTSIVMLCQAGRHDRVEQVARDNLAEARRLVAALQPVVLDGRTLADALARVVQSFADDTDIAAVLDVVGDPRPLARAEEVALVRTAQEALANVRQHSAATSVRVRLRFDDPVTLSITDDGRGFDPAAVDGGFGLRGLRDRIAEVRGALDVRSTPDGGTTVEVSVP